MTELFSQRVGIVPQKILQIDSMDNNLRMSLWNVLSQKIWHIFNNESPILNIYFPESIKFIHTIWADFFYEAIDDAPQYMEFASEVKSRYFTFSWYKVYDLLDFIANSITECFYSENGENPVINNLNHLFIIDCNRVFTRELSGYRSVGTRIIPVTSETEIQAINEALLSSQKYTEHLRKAVDLLADRQSPDYANSIKESISAVEAICRLITGKAVLSEALNKIEAKIGTLSPTLKAAFQKLYAFTSDAQGIRHGMLGESSLDIDDAKFMLIACSAFINYVLSKASSAGIPIVVL